MESAGPMTRSRARHVDEGVPSSATTSTRKKAAPRSTRKSAVSKTPPASPKPASRVEDVPVEEADDTAATADIPEAAAHTDDSSVPAEEKDACGPSDAAMEAPPQARGTPAPPASAAISGLTPALPQSTALAPGGTPVGYEPSPVVPMKLESLWSPQTAQQRGGSSTPGVFSPVATSAGGESTDSGKASAGQCASSTPSDTVDLASMFISTPAAAGSNSPVEGLVAPAAEGPDAEEEGAPAAEPQPTPEHQQLQAQRQQQKLETPSANDQVLMGSPLFAFAEPGAAAVTVGDSPAALPAATEPADGTNRSSGAPTPSAPMLPSPAPSAAAVGTPGWNQDTPLPPTETPAGRRMSPLAATGASAAGPGVRVTPARSTPGSVLRSPGMTDDPDVFLPPATGPDYDEDREYSVPSALDPMMMGGSSPLGFAASPQVSTAGCPAAAGRSPMSVQRGGTPAAFGSPQASHAGTPMAAGEPEDTDMDAAAAAAGPEDDERYEHELLQEAAAEVDLLAEQLQAVPTDSSGTEQHSGEQQQDDDDMESEGPADAAGAVQGEESAMEASFGSPAAAGTPGVTSPGARYRSSSATTAAPPKSALAKPKGIGSSSVAPKHAHVVVPDAASPKTAPPAKASAARKAAAVPNSAAARLGHTQGQNTGSSPGHTPFPSRSKIRAATAAAERGTGSTAAAAAAASSKGPSHKKELALAAAHSALKRYSKAAAEVDHDDGSLAAAGMMSPPPSNAGLRTSPSPSPSPTIPNVSSRLMQPTASSSAKARYSGASEGPDALMWSPPSPQEAAAAAAAAAVASPAAASSKPRLASKIVVPSPPAASADPSLKALKRSIKSKVADKAKATVQEAQADRAAADAVRSSKLASGKGSKEVRTSRKAAAAAAEEELDLDMYDEEEYEEEAAEMDEGLGQDVDTLADSMAGLSVKPVRVAQPRGPLKGVAAPTGRHFKFDDAGILQETPTSRQRRAPRHTKFDDDGNPLPVQQQLPRWR